MRCLAIGDIHGCHRALTALERAVPFRGDDLLITLGDYVDRGPASRRVMEWLIDREQTGLLIPLRGNHELLMLEARSNPDALSEWLRQGGDKTLASYETTALRSSWASRIPDAHWQFIEQACVDWHERKNEFFVHANAEPSLPMKEQTGMMLFWEHLKNTQPHNSGKTMICGHTPQRDGRPFVANGVICIDTHACGGGWLTCLDIETFEYWQASDEGRVRQGAIRR